MSLMTAGLAAFSGGSASASCNSFTRALRPSEELDDSNDSDDSGAPPRKRSKTTRPAKRKNDNDNDDTGKGV